MHATAHSRTAEFMALFRALETASGPRKRLFNDPAATSFLRPGLRAVAALARLPPLHSLICRFIDERWPGARTSGVARTRYIDETLCDALSAGIGQVVILGAGFDSRASRLPALAKARVFEIDHPNTSRLKRARTAAPHVRYIGIDFNHQTLAEALPEAGLDLGKPTFFLWEGVTQYLSAEAVDSTFRFVATAARGTRIVFTYVHAAALNNSSNVTFDGMTALKRTLEKASEPWTFGFDPATLSTYLARRGLKLQTDLNAADYRALYAGLAALDNSGYEFYRVARAAV